MPTKRLLILSMALIGAIIATTSFTTPPVPESSRRLRHGRPERLGCLSRRRAGTAECVEFRPGIPGILDRGSVEPGQRCSKRCFCCIRGWRALCGGRLPDGLAALPWWRTRPMS
jgi:hypothetical protein